MFELMGEVLRPFIEKELHREYGEAWQQVLSVEIEESKRGPQSRILSTTSASSSASSTATGRSSREH
jgi:hypothetical protein